MARIYGIRSSNPDLLRPRAKGEVAPFSAGAAISEGKLSSPGSLLGWASAGGGATLFEDESFAAVLDGTIFAIEGQASTDARALLLAALRTGDLKGAFARINGDFAFAAVSKKSKELFLARDRFGMKPLYFGRSGEQASFASLPLTVANLLRTEPTPRTSFVGRYLAAHYRFFDNDPELSPYEGIFQVAQGQIVTIGADGFRREKFWELTDQGDLDLSEPELAARYRELFLDSVKIRTAAAPKPRAYTLSGGMDSSSVLASSVKVLGEKQVAYSSVYVDKTYDESEEIRSMLDSAVSEWRTVKIEIPDTFETVQQLVRIHEEPVVTATWLSHFLLSTRVAEQGVRGLFGGMGGDELNAGEYEYFWFFFADLKTSGQNDLLLAEIDKWTEYHDHPIFKKSRAIVDTTLPKMADLSKPGLCLADPEKMFRYRATLNPAYFDMGGVKPLMRTPFKSYLKNRCFQDLTVETAPPCLRAEDRHGGYYGTENFLPFLDHRLVELMFQVRGTQKIRAGVTKHLLREAMKGILPEETRTRVKKTGWNAPAHVWFSGKGGEKLMDMIRSQAFRERGIYNVPEIERIVREHHEIVSQGLPKDNHMMFLWQLVNLELWLRG